jgi:hypothetical protein
MPVIRRVLILHARFFPFAAGGGTVEGFTAVFFLQCMDAIGCKTIHLENT